LGQLPDRKACGMPRSPGVKLIIEREVVASMTTEAAARYPLETGGILMGYWRNPTSAVATVCVGPGPRAVHREETFTPDHDWHRAEVARIYRASGRLDTYLGDWHSHPDARDATLSRKDRSTLYRIASDPAARAPAAIMVVLLGEPGIWRVGVWLGRATRRCFVSRLTLTAVDAVLSD
jgi:integrative and conjugative element protein (TIGR02256 family)